MPNLDISVQNPVTHNTWENGRYTSYEISIDTKNKSFCLPKSKSRRRYSEFVWLCKRLKSRHPRESLPSFPPKTFWKERFDNDFIAFRMKGLETFIHKLLDVKLFMSDAGVHLFLQTNLTCQQIDDFMSGKIPPEDINSVWEANGLKEQSGAFGHGGDESFEDLSGDFQPKGNNLAHIEDKLSECSSLGPDEQEDCSSSSSSTSDMAEYPPMSLVDSFRGDDQDKQSDHISRDVSSYSSQENLCDMISQTSSLSIQDRLSDNHSQSSQCDSGMSSCGETTEINRDIRCSENRPLKPQRGTTPNKHFLHSNQYSIN